jgi:hypothetical protein
MQGCRDAGKPDGGVIDMAPPANALLVVPPGAAMLLTLQRKQSNGCAQDADC